MQLPTPGTLFDQRYVIADVLGEGSFARVYKARDNETDAFVALKILAPRQGKYTRSTESRFRREAKLAAKIDEPHAIAVHDWGKSQSGLLYIATELIDGVQLRELIEQEGRIPPMDAVAITRQLLLALRAAHAIGILHRDIKPSNVLVRLDDSDGYRVKLLDFGLAKPAELDVTRITAEGRIAGTPRYMSPEQVCGEPLAETSDLFSIGSVMFEMLVGTPAFDGDTMRRLLKNVVAPQPVLIPTGVPRPLRKLLRTLLAKKPAARFQSAESALRALDVARTELVDDDPDATVPYEDSADPKAVTIKRPRRPRASPRWILAVFAVVITVLVVLFILSALPV